MVGSPMETWEQLRLLKKTEALREWRWLRRAPEETPARSMRERCRKAECLTKVNGLEAEIQFVKAELAPLKMQPAIEGRSTRSA